jgi:hypothetical protein
MCVHQSLSSYMYLILSTVSHQLHLYHSLSRLKMRGREKGRVIASSRNSIVMQVHTASPVKSLTVYMYMYQLPRTRVELSNRTLGIDPCPGTFSTANQSSNKRLFIQLPGTMLTHFYMYIYVYVYVTYSLFYHACTPVFSCIRVKLGSHIPLLHAMASSYLHMRRKFICISSCT